MGNIARKPARAFFIERSNMNIDFIDELIMPIITAACLCIGFVMKKWMPTDDKWIPTVLLVLGALSGLILFGADYEGIVKGMVSGLAAVGLHQVFKQHMKVEPVQNTFNADSFLEMLDEALTESEVAEYEDKNEMSGEE